MNIIEILSIIFLPAITILIGAIGWFLKDKFKGLIATDERLETKIDTIDSKVGKIDGRVANIEGRMGIGYATASSPIHLTPKGEEILIESGAKTIIDNEDNKNVILDKILAEPKPTNAYDAQVKTKQIIREMAGNQMFTPVKNYAFQKGIELDVILNVISIYFRDFVLEKLGFKSEDLDE